MATLEERLREDMKTAMRARDDVRLRTIRGVLSAFTNELVATGHTPQEKISDEGAEAVLMRLAKQRKDSIEQFEKGGRNDLADEEKKELAVLDEYLPEMMSRDEIKKIAEAKKAELGIEDKAKAGQLMGAVMKELKGKADGGDVKAVVDELFS